ncbi:hypothetical protein SAMD00019534_057610 [Acytostelium subglobosum LB1]|uniref:hypothetical protein n=1 Tax=Acytostelium subglobosum LB1 TaxID=1410327 RepID=UPI000644EE13|nr:hypothetical protein SAMD00019534_057610 [Acytostelium subglobosum LB1]GAM22586.1 hypothetical protein SAMD00019534_057610 [Acytostelium subglobosum LB1]|eukprot:XP_012754706.1 hypothetical protein SAMD00019534_057610 [Acytostelium subglobosum LB1]
MVLNKRSVEQVVHGSAHLDGASKSTTTSTPSSNAAPHKSDKERLSQIQQQRIARQQKQAAAKAGSGGFVNNKTYVNAAGLFMFFFYCAMMYYRYQHRGAIGFADSLWTCNIAVLFGWVAVVLNKPYIISMGLCATFIVHAIWVVDVVTWFATGSFPLGNAEYISWPNITWGEIITSTHHAWFVPLGMSLLHRNGGYRGGAWFYAFLIAIPTILISLLFPKELIMPNGDVFYLNINCAHEWWKDVRGWPFSLIPYEQPQYLMFLYAFSFFLFSVTHIVLKLISYVTIRAH